MKELHLSPFEETSQVSRKEIRQVVHRLKTLVKKSIHELTSDERVIVCICGYTRLVDLKDHRAILTSTIQLLVDPTSDSDKVAILIRSIIVGLCVQTEVRNRKRQMERKR